MNYAFASGSRGGAEEVEDDSEMFGDKMSRFAAESRVQQTSAAKPGDAIVVNIEDLKCGR